MPLSTQSLAAPFTVRRNRQAQLAASLALNEGGRPADERPNLPADLAEVVVERLIAAPPAIDAVPDLGARGSAGYGRRRFLAPVFA